MRLWNTIGIIILDQITKYIVVHTIKLHHTIPITKFFSITYIQNKGIAFGIMNNFSHPVLPILFISINIFAVIILILWSIRPENNIWINTGLSLIIGGAVGNLIDRFIFGSVVDFLDFHIAQYHWPAFNIADMAITIGTILLGIGFIVKGKYVS